MRLGILVVAYNAATTLEQVLERIPEDFRPRITEVLVADDHSSDATHDVGVRFRERAKDLTITVVRHERNLGYGGNQKAGYRWAIDRGLDAVVLLHGDGQYAPELLPELVAPLERGDADAVLGSRMLVRGAARRGGMPSYKYVGNRILTAVQNAVVGTDLSEWHSGYRAYSVDALARIPFDRNSDGFDFDTQVILQLMEAGARVAEVPIPTYYGDEICYVNGLGYARDVVREVLRYRAHKMGFGSGELAFASDAYEQKLGPETSHGRILEWMKERPAGRVLDVGCSDGSFGARLRDLGHQVTGVDMIADPSAESRLDQFVRADLDVGLPAALGNGYDVVLCADVLEHVRRPQRLLDEAVRVLAPGGRIIASVPNFGHWYPRIRVSLGRFDYDRRGILDADHVRFFTARSFERIVASSRLSIERREVLGIPVEVAARGAQPLGRTIQSTRRPRARSGVAAIDALLVKARPQLFGYQFVYELIPAVS